MPVSSADALARLTRPERVAIVGGSADPSKIAGRPVKYLRRGAFAGAAYLVNPGLPQVDGFVSVKSVASLPSMPDVAFVALGPKAAVDAVRELAQLGTPVAIVLASGFADGGPDGEGLQADLVEAAGKMRVLGPNTLGVINMTDGIFLTPSDSLESPGLEAGSIAVASQSGGIMGALLSRAAGRGIKFSRLYSTGNECDLEIADCIAYLATDVATSVIVVYLETLRNPPAFIAAAQLAQANGKPVVCYKVGVSEAGASAASSHTGALAGSDRIFDAVFARAGVIRVRQFSELLDIPAALANGKRLHGNRVGVLTTTGGAGTLIADACGSLGLTLPTASEGLVAKLNGLFPSVHIDLSHNPIDLTLAGTRPEVMGPVVDALVDSTDFDALVVVIGSSGVAQPRLVADPLIAAASRPGTKPIFAFAGPYVPEVIARLNSAGVPAFDAPETCAAALRALLPTSVGDAIATSEVKPTKDLTGRWLNEDESKDLLARFGIKSPARVVVKKPSEFEGRLASLKGPFALKVLSRELQHKSDVGGVALGVEASDVVASAEALIDAVTSAGEAHRIEGVLAEEMTAGQELILGMIRDPVIGPAVLLGSGGLAAEFIEDTAVSLLPVDLTAARELIGRLRIAPLLSGSRGQSPSDIDALANAIVAFSGLVSELGSELIEAEINPLVVLERGFGVLALDAVVHLRTE